MKQVARVLLCLFFVAAGAFHFLTPEFYLPMMPAYLPWHLELIYLSGFFEILGGLGLLSSKTRLAAAFGLIALLVAVFPANLHMAHNRISPPGFGVSPALLWLRLPLQLIFISWAWWIRRD